MENEKPVCEICGEPMPAGEEMFKFHGYSGPCPKSPKAREPEDTIQEYLERAETAGVIDFHLRTVRTPEGKLDFYIHPQGHDGETGDFTVSGSFVSKIKGNVAAGSSRPMGKPLLGSSADEHKG